jgi:peptidoglycan DL-endopeptidase CwlO
MRVLVIVVATLATGCASANPRPQPFPRHRPAATTGTEHPNDTIAGAASGYEVSGTALDLRGTPYRNGGADPNGGFDCSGLVWYVYAQHGLSVPRTVQDQYRIGGTVPAVDLRPGDLVFFSTTSPGPTHVGIIIGGDSFVHAPSSTGVVRVERLSAPYWTSRFVGARRLLQ